MSGDDTKKRLVTELREIEHNLVVVRSRIGALEAQEQDLAQRHTLLSDRLEALQRVPTDARKWAKRFRWTDELRRKALQVWGIKSFRENQAWRPRPGHARAARPQTNAPSTRARTARACAPTHPRAHARARRRRR